MLQQGAGPRQGQQVADLLELFIGPLGGWLDDRDQAAEQSAAFSQMEP